MLNVGVIGLGFIGRTHAQSWRKTPGARLVAVCDPDPKKFAARSRVVGNIRGAAAGLDLKGLAGFTDLGAMLKQARLDAVSVCVPTYLHPEVAIRCLEAGVHVLCEKPMALTSAAGRTMIAAARRTRRRLMIGQCLRFLPEYAAARDLAASGRFGRVLAASFLRLSAPPTWSWKNWIVNPALSGDAALDLHIHDADFVQHLFGLPRAVFSRAVRGPFSRFDHIATQYLYPDGKVVTAEGGWIMGREFPFQAGFTLILEKAALAFDTARQPAFRLYPAKGAMRVPAVPPGDAHGRQLAYFAAALAGKKQPTLTTLEESCASVRLVEAEKKSATTGRVVAVR